MHFSCINGSADSWCPILRCDRGGAEFHWYCVHTDTSSTRFTMLDAYTLIMTQSNVVQTSIQQCRHVPAIRSLVSCRQSVLQMQYQAASVSWNAFPELQTEKRVNSLMSYWNLFYFILVFCLFGHSFTRWLLRSFIRLLVDSFIRSRVHSLICLFIYFFFVFLFISLLWFLKWNRCFTRVQFWANRLVEIPGLLCTDAILTVSSRCGRWGNGSSLTACLPTLVFSSPVRYPSWDTGSRTVHSTRMHGTHAYDVPVGR